MSGTLIGADILSPAPILDAAQRYRGTMVDLSVSCVLGPDEFAKAREALTRWLAANGLSAGDRVVVALANGPLFIATLVAILACEASPLVVHSKTPPAELLRYARRFGARFLAGEPEDESGREQIETTTTRVAFADVLPLDWSTLSVGEARAGRDRSCGACRCTPPRARPACRRSRCGRDLPQWKKPGIMRRRCRSTPTTR